MARFPDEGVWAVCVLCAGTLLNIAPGSVVNRNGESQPPATSVAWQNCP